MNSCSIRRSNTEIVGILISKNIALVGISTNKIEIINENGQDLADQLKIGYYETIITDKQQISQILRDMTEKILLYKTMKKKGKIQLVP